MSRREMGAMETARLEIERLRTENAELLRRIGALEAQSKPPAEGAPVAHEKAEPHDKSAPAPKRR